MKSQLQSALSDEYLRAYSADHLLHEIKMLFDTGSHVPYGASSPSVQFVDDAVLESFVLHLRNLIDFFYPRRILDDDVIAAHYFDSGQTPPTFPSESPLFREARGRADKQVNHLTTKRIFGHPADKEWDAAPLLIEIANIVGVFLEGASPQKLDRGFVAQVKELVRTRS
jgi:hypothetical protein